MDNSGLLKYEFKVVMLKDLTLREEVMKLHYNDPLIRYYKVEKTLELLKRS
jgi:hypothetical protein